MLKRASKFDLLKKRYSKSNASRGSQCVTDVMDEVKQPLLGESFEPTDRLSGISREDIQSKMSLSVADAATSLCISINELKAICQRLDIRYPLFCDRRALVEHQERQQAMFHEQQQQQQQQMFDKQEYQ